MRHTAHLLDMNAEEIFAACVRLLNWLAVWCGTDYVTINVVIFCMIWPAVTLLLIMWVWYERRLRRLAEYKLGIHDCRVVRSWWSAPGRRL